jgi:hypothetical protein
MSRGIGKTQTKCLEAVNAADGPISSAEVAATVFHTDRWTYTRQCWRSLVKLAHRGLVDDMGRQAWGGPRLFRKKEHNVS